MDGTGRADEPAEAGSGASAATDDAGRLSDEERKTRLNRAVYELTRECRATVRSRDEFAAVVVRGRPVNHRLHLAVAAALAVLAPVLWFGLGGGGMTLVDFMAVPAVYALFWLFITFKGGEEVESVWVDEDGVLHSVKTGRDPDARGEFIRNAIPIALIVVSGWVTVGLIHDIAFPPPPNCDQPAKDQPQKCMTLPNFEQLPGASLTLSSPSGGRSAAPTVAPSPAASGTAATVDTAAAGILDSADTQMFERIVRGLQLIVSLIVLLVSTWFLWPMLTGRRAMLVGLVRHRLGDG
jgi:hypothetical protein